VISSAVPETTFFSFAIKGGNEMRKSWKVAVLCGMAVVGLVTIFIVAYVNNVGYNNLKLMYTLRTTDKMIIEMEDKGKYLALDTLSIESLIKERMLSKGWSFVDQEGANYFFEKEDERVFITSQQWNHNYIIFHVKDNVVNIAD